LDWRSPEEDAELAKKAERLGPPLEHRVSETKALDELERVGFQWIVSHSGFCDNWCLTARK
jgi:hypothetical protein